MYRLHMLTSLVYTEGIEGVWSLLRHHSTAT